MTIGIYGIFDGDTNRCLYVGQSVSVATRWYHHRHKLSKGIHHNKDLQAWVAAHGLERLRLTVLEPLISGELLLEKERMWTERCKPAFIGRAPGGSWRWSELSEQTLARVNKTKQENSKKNLKEMNNKWGEQVELLYSTDGLSTEEIARRLSISYAYVLKICKLRDVQYRSKRDSIGIEYAKLKTASELKQELLMRRSNGESWSSIAEVWGCSASTVKDFAKKLETHTVDEPNKAIKSFDSLTLEEQKKLITKLLGVRGLTIDQASSELGMGRSSLYRRMGRLGL